MIRAKFCRYVGRLWVGTCRSVVIGISDVPPLMLHRFRYVYDEEAETEYITEVMMRKLTDKEPAAKYNRSSRKASMGVRSQGYTVTRATDRTARGKGASMPSWLVNGLRGAKAVSTL